MDGSCTGGWLIRFFVCFSLTFFLVFFLCALHGSTGSGLISPSARSEIHQRSQARDTSEISGPRYIRDGLLHCLDHHHAAHQYFHHHQHYHHHHRHHHHRHGPQHHQNRSNNLEVVYQQALHPMEKLRQGRRILNVYSSGEICFVATCSLQNPFSIHFQTLFINCH